MHNPGPWKIGDQYGPVMDEIVGGDGRTVCAVWTHRPRVSMRGASHRREAEVIPEAMENVALICAAPDLLAALENIVMASDANDEGSLANAIQEGIAAIAKARGE